MRREPLAAAACALLLAALLAIDIGAPWTWIHDDNGAWTQAVASAHLRAGLGRTRGQDFFLRRADGALVPYLHHPPLYPLVTAAAYRITGHSGPLVTRLVPALAHLVGLLGLWRLGRALFPASPARRVLALLVAALVPMSSFFGKVAFNEPLGLALCVWAVVLTVRARREGTRGATAGACALWLLALATSWSSAALLGAFAALAALEARAGAPGRARLAWALGATGALGVGAVVLHLLWAGGWQRPPLAVAGAHWGLAALGPAGALRALGKAFDLHRIYFANVPFALFLGWLATRARRALAGGTPGEADRVLLAGAAGAAAWALAFLPQVAVHAYGQFWYLPFESLAVADLAVTAWDGLAARRALRVALAALALAGTLASTAATLHYRYTHPEAYALRTARLLAETYVSRP